MTGFWIVVGIPIIVGLAANEMSDLSPWLAEKVIRRAAYLWATGDPDRAAVLYEEWRAVVLDCPGKLTKLVLALRFLAGATWRHERGRVVRLFRIIRQRLTLRSRPHGRRITPFMAGTFMGAGSSVLFALFVFAMQLGSKPPPPWPSFVMAITTVVAVLALVLSMIILSRANARRAAEAAQRSAEAAKRAARAKSRSGHRGTTTDSAGDLTPG